MSKTIPRKTYPPEKNVFMSQTIPETFIDKVRTLSNAGEYGELEELLTNNPYNLNFTENKLNTSLLHGVIKSSLTNTQKLRLVELLINKGIPINILDSDGYPPLYYAIKLQLVEIVVLLMSKTNNLPENYDYFRVALNPNPVNCKPQLLNQSIESMGKYYSQHLDFERKFKNVINSQPITSEIIKYLLQFCKDLPKQELKYVDLDDNNEIKSTFNVENLGSEYIDIFPPFENTIEKFIRDIPNKMKESLKGKINDDQLITTKIELVKSLFNELKTFLNIKSVNDTISENKDYNYKNTDTPDEVYNNFIKLSEFNFDTIIDQFNNKYANEFNNYINEISSFRSDIETKLKELMILESTLMSNYPIFSSGISENKGINEIPSIIIGPSYPLPAAAALQQNILVNKLESRLFYNSAMAIDPVIINQQIINFRGGYLGMPLNKIDTIIKLFDNNLKIRDPNGPNRLLHSRLLVQNIENGLNGILGELVLGNVYDPNVTPIPPNPSGWDDNVRDRITFLRDYITNFNDILKRVSENGIKINNLFNQIQPQAIELNKTITDYNNSVTLLISTFNSIYNAIYFAQNPYGPASLIATPAIPWVLPAAPIPNRPAGKRPAYPYFDPLDGYFNNLLQYLNDIINNVNNFGNASINIYVNPVPPNNPKNITFLLRDYSVNYRLAILQVPINWINFNQLTPPHDHLYYDKIVPIFNSIQTNIPQFDSNDDIIININKVRKIIYLTNSTYILINYCIQNSKLVDEYNNNFNNLNQLNNLINPILTDSIKSKQLKDLEILKNKTNDILSYLNQINNGINNNVKKFNIFITELNNISEQYLLYNKFNLTNPNKKFLFNNLFVLIKLTNQNMNLLSLYTDDIQDLSYYTQLPLAENLQYRYVLNNTINNLQLATLPLNIPNDSLSNLMYLPNKKKTNINYLFLIYYEKIFKAFIPDGTASVLPNPRAVYTNIKKEFKQKNPTINDSILDTIIIKILHDSILNNFNDILNIVLLSVSNSLINKALDTNLVNPFDAIDDVKILNTLKEKELKKLDKLSRVDLDQHFYLDENYKSSEPIDVLSCVNNDVKILLLLKKKMSINLREYQEQIFKLGNKDILAKLNQTTRDKITNIDLTSYREKNKNKFNKAEEYFYDQLIDDIKQKELDFFNDSNVNISVDDLNIVPIELTMNKETPDLNVNGFTSATVPNWIYQIRFEDIYIDLIDTQKKSNIFLYEKIKNKLELIFQFIILPQVQKFVIFFANDNFNDIIKFDNLKENLRPLISDIINYHLMIDPSKAKIEVIPLDDTLNKFKDLFINLLSQEDKISISSLYEERLKTKIFDYITLISRYYINVYRNYLKWIFNDYRYSLLL
jgi:hypothetical protein